LPNAIDIELVTTHVNRLAFLRKVVGVSSDFDGLVRNPYNRQEKGKRRNQDKNFADLLKYPSSLRLRWNRGRRFMVANIIQM
jgi:hypothetical protein